MNEHENFLVKPAVAKDAAFIIEAQISMALETENIKLNRNIISAGVLSVFQDPGKGFYLISMFKDCYCGCLMITPEWSDWRNNLVWWIQSVYILPEYRKRGVFRLMYEHIRQQVIQRPDISGIRLYVDNTNKSAREVYVRMGMNGSHYSTFEWMK